MPRSHHAKPEPLPVDPITGPGPYPDDPPTWCYHLGPLRLVMHKGYEASCDACHTDVHPGDQCWWTASELHHRKLLCYHCGACVDLANS